MKRKGFTLIELLVVIAIIGLLSTLAVISLNSARGKARDAARLADVKTISTAIELALISGDKTGYDDVITGCVTAGALTTTCIDLTDPPFDFSAVTDPSNESTACKDSSTAGCAYALGTAPSATGYEICFFLESGAGGFATGVYKITQGGTISAGCSV